MFEFVKLYAGFTGWDHILAKVDLPAFTVESTVTYRGLGSVIGMDHHGDCIYTCTHHEPIRVIKTKKEPFQFVEYAEAPYGEGKGWLLVVDKSGKYAYVGTVREPAHILRFKTDPLEYDGSLEFPSGTYMVNGLAIDDNFLYAVVRDPGLSIARIRLSDFTLFDFTKFMEKPPWRYPQRPCIGKGFLFIPCSQADRPEHVCLAKIDLTSWKLVDTITFKEAADEFWECKAYGNYIYVCGSRSLFKIRIDDLAIERVKLLPAPTPFIRGLAVDSKHVYVGSLQRIFKLSANTLDIIDVLDLPEYRYVNFLIGEPVEAPMPDIWIWLVLLILAATGTVISYPILKEELKKRGIIKSEE